MRHPAGFNHGIKTSNTMVGDHESASIDGNCQSREETLQQLVACGISFMVQEEDHSITYLNQLAHAMSGMLEGICYH